ncbi:pyrroloquinoline quinone biosynthesis protein D [Azospirillum fermentarium]|uniref:pyrroloquinoline quinone biosynthesis peptide chaperone PqqD n=1 Tax=Azospirillum fermentarium TaxID=1233114 RepID=UPI002227F981|nr:pyrroloquinoline quinone biosynthesis peptide chaperone PqqD [Azospirillum fermentarium]MCW2249136.1 pyrroloquinoline quinone biosynthesis protein D [Azospirillum fermentarium]
MTDSPTPTISEDSRVRLAPGVMLRHDRARDEWMLLAPERVLVLDETALAVVRATTARDAGTVGEAITRLAADYEAPRADIAADVLEMLNDLLAKGYVVP